MTRYAALLVLIAIAPAAFAGSAQDPEVSDGTGETQSFGLDLEAAWWTWGDNGTLVAHIQIVGGFGDEADCSELAGTPVLGTFRWAEVAARPVNATGADLLEGDGPWLAAVLYAECTSALPAPWTFELWRREDRESPMAYEYRSAQASFDGGVAVIEVPLAALGVDATNAKGAALTETYARSFSGNGRTPATQTLDVAPDDGYGRDLALGPVEDEKVLDPGSNEEKDASALPPAMLVLAIVATLARATARREERT